MNFCYRINLALTDGHQYAHISMAIKNLFGRKQFSSFKDMREHIKNIYFKSEKVFSLKDVEFKILGSKHSTAGTDEKVEKSCYESFDGTEKVFHQFLQPGKYTGKLSYFYGSWHLDLMGNENIVLVISEDFTQLEKMFTHNGCTSSSKSMQVCAELGEQPQSTKRLSEDLANHEYGCSALKLEVNKQIFEGKLCHGFVKARVQDISRIDLKLGSEIVTSPERLCHIQNYCKNIEQNLIHNCIDIEDKLSKKIKIQYSGPIKAKKAVIRYGHEGEQNISFEGFYADCCHS